MAQKSQLKRNAEALAAVTKAKKKARKMAWQAAINALEICLVGKGAQRGSEHMNIFCNIGDLSEVDVETIMFEVYRKAAKWLVHARKQDARG